MTLGAGAVAPAGKMGFFAPFVSSAAVPAGTALAPAAPVRGAAALGYRDMPGALPGFGALLAARQEFAVPVLYHGGALGGGWRERSAFLKKSAQKTFISPGF